MGPNEEQRYRDRSTFLGSEIDGEILRVYADAKTEIQHAANQDRAAECLDRCFDLWMFMNRFRNCDLQFYFDEDIHDAISGINPRKFDTTHLLKKKDKFRIAFVFSAFVDTGGVSFPHRYILEDPVVDGIQFEQYVLVTNLKGDQGFRSSHRFQYLENSIDIAEFHYMDDEKDWLDKGKFIEQWIHDRGIDFVLINPDPASLYAVASRPALVHGVLSPDCYTFALGPGATDLTFLVTPDQVYKYKFRATGAERALKIVMLPLPLPNVIEQAVPYKRADFGIPENALVSASTNMWKSCFGDSEILFEGIAALIRKFPDYHHLFAGTPRCLDNVEYFLSRNPDIAANIHYVGPIKDIYRLLKMIDFYINSFPTSGASNVESAIVGKPSIDLIANRNLDLHSGEFLRSRECEAVSLDEFIALGARYITDRSYREDLGRFLRSKIGREFDKHAIVCDKLYGAYLTVFHDRLKNRTPSPGLELDRTLRYEKRIALYNAYGREHWALDRRRDRLKAWTLEFPSRPFAWIKSLEEAILAEDSDWFAETVERLGGDLLRDHRIQVVLALGHDLFGDQERALGHAQRAASLAIYDKIPARVAARLLVRHGRLAEAAAACPAPQGEGSQAVDEGNVVDILAGLPTDRLPLYYDY